MPKGNIVHDISKPVRLVETDAFEVYHWTRTIGKDVREWMTVRFLVTQHDTMTFEPKRIPDLIKALTKAGKALGVM